MNTCIYLLVRSRLKFCYGVRLLLGLKPTALPPRCDGCGERFTTEHAMSCRKGGLILHRHNDLVTTWGQLCGQALTPSSISDEPLIQTSRDIPVAGTKRAQFLLLNSEVTLPFMVFGQRVRQRYLMFELRTLTSQQTVKPNLPRSCYAMKRRKRTNMVTFV